MRGRPAAASPPPAVAARRRCDFEKLGLRWQLSFSTLDDALRLTGVVRIDGELCVGASVVLRESGAGQVRTVATHLNGRFVHELPPPGYYVLVVVDPVTRRSHAQKVAVTIAAINLDIDL